jgi:hypothetical protein
MKTKHRVAGVAISTLSLVVPAYVALCWILAPSFGLYPAAPHDFESNHGPWRGYRLFRDAYGWLFVITLALLLVCIAQAIRKRHAGYGIGVLFHLGCFVLLTSHFWLID